MVNLETAITQRDMPEPKRFTFRTKPAALQALDGSCPIARQKKHAKALEAAGANVVVGSHAHVLQGGGWRGDT